MRQFRVTEIRRITKDGEHFLKAGMVYAVAKDGYYIFYSHKSEPEVDSLLSDTWPKKSKAGNIVLFRDYWRYWDKLDMAKDNTGPYYLEIATLPYKVLA